MRRTGYRSKDDRRTLKSVAAVRFGAVDLMERSTFMVDRRGLDAPWLIVNCSA